jgi:thiosulfate reductase cytochrome b subunit
MDTSAGILDRAMSVPRHRLVTRLTHWTNALAMAILLMSGLQILNAHPALYWGKAGYAPNSAWLDIYGDTETPPQGILRIGRTSYRTTGLLGVFGSGDHLVMKAFPGWLTIPSWRDLATGRRWHFFFAWVLVLNGMAYLAHAAFTGHLRRDLLPNAGELAPRHLARDLWNHLRLRFPKGPAALAYNPLQKISYVFVILILAPLMVLTGLAMSPGFDAAGPWLLDLFGGRQSARSLHFIAANLLVLFFLAHMAALLAVGVWNELRSMITGRYRIDQPE